MEISSTDYLYIVKATLFRINGEKKWQLDMNSMDSIMHTDPFEAAEQLRSIINRDYYYLGYINIISFPIQLVENFLGLVTFSELDLTRTLQDEMPKL